ncbi:MAG: ribose transport system ATP-binding protein [Rhodothermales bacterium]|jgi:ribose transport system ATP-binding protein
MNVPADSILEVRGVGKQFPGVRALHDIHFHLGQGEVVALLGENGAGKSTLMKILAGVQMPDSGQILVDGKPVLIRSVHEALDLGIALIHQELNLCDNFDIAANIFLGREPRKMGMIDEGKMRAESAKVLARVGLNVLPTHALCDLTIGHQQLVEIAKALSTNARILIMDEPTSSLTGHETERLFEVVKLLRSEGVSIVYISHRLSEVKELADRVVVFRDGENAGHLSCDEIDHDRMVRLMVGRDVSQFYARQAHTPGKTMLEVKNLVTPAHPEKSLNFSVRAGEIVGVAGLVGAGRTEMLQVLFGVDEALGGSVEIDGEAVDFKSPRDAIEAGLALVPEDRKQQGLILEMPVRQNISLPGLRRHRVGGVFLNTRQESADTDEMIAAMRIRTPNADQVSQYLSGGNQQKVILGKWLALNPRVLLLDEPTRGIDVGAKEEIYQLMETLASDGVAILFVSSEMEEVLGMSDRTLVMHEGCLTGELQRDELSEEAIMQLATGNV